MLLTCDEMYSLCNGLHCVSSETWKKITKKGGWYEQYDGMEENRNNIPKYTMLRGWMCEALLVAWQFTFGEILYVFNDKGQILPEIDTNYKGNSGHSIVDGCILFKDGTLIVNSSKIKDVGSLGITASDVNNLLAVSDTIVSKLPNMVNKVVFYVCSASAWSPQAIDLINAHILRKDHYYLKTVLLDEREEKKNFNEKHEYFFMKDVCRTIGIFLDDYGYKFPRYDEIHHTRNVLSVTQFDKRNELIEKFEHKREVLYNADCRTGKTPTSTSVVDNLKCLNISDKIVIFGNFPSNNDQMIKKICDYDEKINCGVVKPDISYDKFVYNPEKKNVALLSAQMVSISSNGEIKPCVKEIIDLNPNFLIVDEAHYGIASDFQRKFLKSNFNCPILYLTGTADTPYLRNIDTVRLIDTDIYKNMAEDSETYLNKNNHKRNVRYEINMPDGFDVATLEADITELGNGSYDIQTIENQRKEAFESALSQIFTTLDITDNHNSINDVFKNQRTGKGILKDDEKSLIGINVALFMVETIKSQDIWSNVLKIVENSDLYDSIIVNSIITPGSKAMTLINDFIKTPSNKKKIIFTIRQGLIGSDFLPGLDAVVNWTHKHDTMSLTKQQGSNRSKTPIGENRNPVSVYMTPYKEEICRISRDDVYSMTHNGKNSIPEKIAQKLAVTSTVYKLFDKNKPSVEKAEDITKIYDKMMDELSDYEIFSSFNVRTYHISGYIDDSKYSIENLDIDNIGCKMPYVVCKETNELVKDKNGNPITYDKLCMDNNGNLLSLDDVKNTDKVKPVKMMETGRYIDNPKFKSNVDENKLSKLGEILKKDLGYNHQFYQERVFWYTLEGLQALLLIYYIMNKDNLDVSFPNHRILLEMIYGDKELSNWFLSHKIYKETFPTVDSICMFLDTVYGLNNIDSILENWYNGIIKNEHIRRWIMNNRIYKRQFGEVLTPKKLVNEMLDEIPDNIYKNKNESFIDNSFGTGNFLIEIVKRCMELQEDDFKTEEERFEWIIKNRIYGIEIQERNVKLALYRQIYDDEKDSQRKFNPTLNYNNWWVESGHCVCSDALTFDYSKFGNVEFNFIGNPPYQLLTKDDTTSINRQQATPLYDKFVNKAKQLNSKNILMVIPARWFSGGMGLSDFRNEMLHDDRIKSIHDFLDAKECFPDVEIKGGVCYFLWDKDYKGLCNIYTHQNGKIISSSKRSLLENGNDTFIRYNDAIPILHKISKLNEKSISNIISPLSLFGFPSNYKDYEKEPKENYVKMYGNKFIGYVPKEQIKYGKEYIDKYKVLLPEAVGIGGFDLPFKPIITDKNSCCTTTYVVIGAFDTKEEAINLSDYIKTNFFKFLVGLKKITQHATSKVYQFVPIQDFNEKWTDEKLYKKYNLSQDDIKVIETNIKQMV